MKVIKQIGRFKILAVLALTTAAFLVVRPLVVKVWAGSPHLVGAFTTSCSGDTLTVTGKEAGLGDETQITVTISGTASCINGGDHHPKAANKESISTTEVVPVQNGKANFDLTLTATFQPDCPSDLQHLRNAVEAGPSPPRLWGSPPSCQGSPLRSDPMRGFRP